MLIKHTICPLCSVGCGVNLINHDEKIIGIYPYKKHPINEGKNCLKGRNSYKSVDENRIITPLKKEKNQLIESNWQNIIDLIIKPIKSHSSEEIGIILSGKSTNEENYIIKNFAENNNIKNIGFYSHNFPYFEKEENFADYDDLNNVEFIFMLGNIFQKNPLIGRRIIIAKDNGARIFSAYSNITTSSINSDKYFNISSISKFLNDFPDEIEENLNEKSVIVFNELENRDDFKKIVEIANKTKSKVLPVLSDSNSWGTMKYFAPLDKNEVLNIINNVKTLIFINFDILSSFGSLDDINLSNLDFLISIDSSLNDTSSFSDVILPNYSWAEKFGTFTNTIGEDQKFEKSIECSGSALSIEEIFNRISDNLK